jgi:uncharacterized membrane protein
MTSDTKLRRSTQTVGPEVGGALHGNASSTIAEASASGGTNNWKPGREAPRDSNRIEAFSDAVIGIMLTLLAVELLQLDYGEMRKVGLIATLEQKWTSYGAFALTFLVVGQIWMTHHNLWRYIARVDQGISVLNLLLLLIVCTIPFSAKILAESFGSLSAGDQSIAAILYSATMLGQALAFNAVLWWSRWRRLLDERMSDALFRAIAIRFLAGPALYAVALATAAWAPKAGLACYLGVVLLYLWPGAGDLPGDGPKVSESRTGGRSP